jgi:hypothetical protein
VLPTFGGSSRQSCTGLDQHDIYLLSGKNVLVPNDDPADRLTCGKSTKQMVTPTPYTMALHVVRTADSACGERTGKKKGCHGGSPFLHTVANPISSKMPQSP